MWSIPLLDPILERKFYAFRSVPDRNPRSAAKAKAAFLVQAESMSQAVSRSETRRLSSWITTIQNLFGRKEPNRMFTSLVTFLVMVSLVLGGAGASVYAAQDSLPGQGLYLSKTFSEEVQFSLTSDPQEKFELQLRFANRRFEEVLALMNRGESLPEPLLQRWQHHLEMAFRLAVGLEAGQLISALEVIQTQLRTQLRMMDQLKAGPSEDATLARIRAMLQNRLKWAQSGLEEPGLPTVHCR